MNAAFFRRIADSRWFNLIVLGVILGAGVLVGVETYQQDPDSPWRDTLAWFDFLVLIVFTLEFAIKIGAEGDRPWRYFSDPWNVFDFAIVAICWLAHLTPSVDASFVAVIRLARVLRVFRLVHALPQLKMLVNAMLKSIPSMGYVGLMLLLLYYIYGAMGVFLFGKNDPLHFGTLHTAMLTLFEISTLEGWVDILKVNMFGCDHAVWGYEEGADCANPNAQPNAAVLYFVSFVLFGTMIILNLFIGVIMNAMDEVRAEQSLEERQMRKIAGVQNLEDEIVEIHQQLDNIKKQLDYIAFRLKK
ncbi:MAG: ion transporter [Saprospiraceae bacterium]|nr:ion transporter [Saprospiraceae bacterium]